MAFELLGLTRMSDGPLVDDDGEPVPVFWVECCVCGGEYPMRRDAEGRLVVPATLSQFQGVDKAGKPCTPVYYASAGCSKRAHKVIVRTHDEASGVVTVPHPVTTTKPQKKVSARRR